MSGDQNWRTPRWLCAYLIDRFGCRYDVTAKEFCAHGMIKTGNDGLIDHPWPNNAFANPPWREMTSWVYKAINQRVNWVMIAPASVTTNWFNALADYSTIYLPNIRIAYEDESGRDAPMHGSIIAVGNERQTGGAIYRLDLRSERNGYYERLKAADELTQMSQDLGLYNG